MMMDLMDFIQTTGAISGLMCLMMVLLSTKKQLKENCCR